MDKLIKKLDEIFAKYGVEQSEVEEVGNLINEVAGGELLMDGEEFNAPVMEKETADAEEDVYED